ncbi:hypothetical protein GCM10023116_20840 [Kistimonas scapharcae]|uniref:Ankyrin repeat domain-containing protein n=2 Tax=Kistimonas scapharcae TaxID=1036133 RepID=A0ABP8V0P5_9GAMM
MYAVRNGRSEVVEFLLGEGANVEHKSHMGLTALMLAAVLGNLEVARHLLTKGANINEKSTINGSEIRALDLALWKGHAEMVELLIRAERDWRAAEVSAAADLG